MFVRRKSLAFNKSKLLRKLIELVILARGKGRLNTKIGHESVHRELLPLWKISICCLVISVLQFPTSVLAHGLVFLDFIGLDRVAKKSPSTLKHNEILSRATVFYTQDFGTIKVLAEFVANETKSHFGRVKIGWKPDQSNVIWTGRTHNPASYWRDQFHHGGWLQPSIIRPSIAEFEVPGGILPAHSTGIALEGGSSVSNTVGLAYNTSLGFTSKLNDDGLEVPSLFGNDRGIHNSSIAFRLSYRFEGIQGGNELGVLGTSNHITGNISSIKEVEQRVFGLFANWVFSDFKLTSELTQISNEVINSGLTTTTEKFVNAYVMADYSISHDWNIYSRWEDTINEDSSQYLLIFPSFVIKRNLVGVRYGINRSQVFKFEVSDNQLFSSEEYRQLAVQWSYVYP